MGDGPHSPLCDGGPGSSAGQWTHYPNLRCLAPAIRLAETASHELLPRLSAAGIEMAFADNVRGGRVGETAVVELASLSRPVEPWDQLMFEIDRLSERTGILTDLTGDEVLHNNPPSPSYPQVGDQGR